MDTVSEKLFNELLQSKLGASWDRALRLFRNCGENLSYDVTNVLIHAADKGKIEEVLKILEEHYESHLQFQHPEIRGQVRDNLLHVNPTQEVFLRICVQTLGLKNRV